MVEKGETDNPAYPLNELLEISYMGSTPIQKDEMVIESLKL